MKPKATPSADVFADTSKDFSLFVGGPLFQILRRAHLTDDALGMIRRRVIVISLLCWLPLAVMSAFEGHLLDAGLSVPFLKDVGMHVRFLVALPLLIGAEFVVHQRMRLLVPQFIERDLIPKAASRRFEAAIASALRLRNSVSAEVIIVAIVYGVGILVVWRQYAALETLTWYATPSETGSKPSLAGAWLSYVSLPVFQFVLLRWYFRLFIWTRFLWHVSRIDLNLIPTHPDRTGGLLFLSTAVYALVPVLFAHGTILAGHIADRIFFVGATLLDFKLEIVGLVVLLILVVLGPLLLFGSQLTTAKLIGLREYGALAQRYVRQFDRKWLRGTASPGEEPLLGSADIQSLADLSHSFEIVKSMNLVPFTKETVLQVGVTAIVPIAPLVLTLIPLEELLKKLFSILL
ncbi:MAG TPA: hypothetical protein VHK68_09080 [Gemmatimonadales bacterium]|nr:hypothetical protein [Gemmatimonadales bacterium]